MSATRILWGQIVAVFLITLAGIWAATQWTAATLGYQQELGPGGLIAVVLAIAMSVWRAREARTSATYGSARWATRSEIAREGLLGGKGAVIGRHANLYLRHDGPEHVLCFAPTRSGKGVGLVVPTLLTWPHSAIVHDIKGENWDLTAGFQ